MSSQPLRHPSHCVDGPAQQGRVRGAGGFVVVGAALAVGVEPDGLGRTDQRGGDEGTGHAGGRAAHERGEHRGRRCQVDGAPDDGRLNDVVLQLLVRQEDDERDQPGQRSLRQSEQDEEGASEKPTDLRDEVGDGGPDRRERSERDAEEQSGGEDHRAVEYRDRHRPGEVAGDGSIDDPSDLVGACASLRRHGPPHTGDQCLAVEQHSDRDDEDQQGESESTDDSTGDVGDRIRIDSARKFVHEPLRVADCVGRFQSLTDHRPRVELLDRRGQLLGEPTGLIGGLGSEHEHETSEREDARRADDDRADRAAALEATLRRTQDRVECERYQQSDAERGDLARGRTEDFEHRHGAEDSDADRDDQDDLGAKTAR